MGTSLWRVSMWSLHGIELGHCHGGNLEDQDSFQGGLFTGSASLTSVAALDNLKKRGFIPCKYKHPVKRGGKY